MCVVLEMYILGTDYPITISPITQLVITLHSKRAANSQRGGRDYTADLICAEEECKALSELKT
jgi:hypothetical protein